MQSSLSPEKHRSDSQTQQNLEEVIFGQLNSIYCLSKQLGNAVLENKKYQKDLNSPAFQVDFFNVEKKIFGEIYACSFPLKSGHIRKIKSDILKLLSIEKLFGESIHKYLILTVFDEKEAQRSEIFYSHEFNNEQFNKLGIKSWFNKAIEIFEIKVFYYNLSFDQYTILTNTRIKQKLGMQTGKNDIA